MSNTTRTGSARPIIAWAALLLTLLCVILAATTGTANGLMLLATIFCAVFAWAVGAFRNTFWTR